MLDLEIFIQSELGLTPTKLAIIGALWTFVAVAMIIDLITGLRKARKAGIARSSELLKRTTNKVLKNYSALVYMVMFDVLFFWVGNYIGVHELSYFPLATILMAFFEIYVEYKSFRENIGDKQRIKDQEALSDIGKLLMLIKEKGDVSEELFKLFKKGIEPNENDK